MRYAVELLYDYDKSKDGRINGTMDGSNGYKSIGKEFDNIENPLDAVDEMIKILKTKDVNLSNLEIIRIYRG